MHPDKDVLFSNVSFSMGKGEKVALIGNNGSGNLDAADNKRIITIGMRSDMFVPTLLYSPTLRTI